jgi:lysophospholipase L1-like esterase
MRSTPRERVAALPHGRRAVFALLPSIVLVLALGGVELGLRRHAPIDSLEVFVQSRWQRDDFDDRDHIRIFEGDPVLFWRLKPNLHDVIWDFTLISTDAQGLRWSRNLGPKPQGGLRIVCLGDSVTFGYRVPLIWRSAPDQYDRSARPYPAIMEAQLRARYPERAVEVVPLAVPGYTSAQGLHWLQSVGADLDADVVLLQYGWNDVSLREAPDRDTMRDGELRRLARTIAAHSQVALHLVDWWQRHRPRSEGRHASPVTRLDESEYVANLLAMAHLAVREGAAPVIIGTIYRDAVTDPAAAARVRSYRAAIQLAAGKAHVDYLEIPQLTEGGYPTNAILFGEAIHPNAAGHRLMAQTILAYIEARGLVAEVARQGASRP